VKLSALSALTLLAAGCTPKNPETQNTGAKTDALQATYGAKNIYLWSRRVKSETNPDTWNSCWYYRETVSADGLDDRGAMLTSIRDNEMSIPDSAVSTQLSKIATEKLTLAGIEVIPCGLAAISLVTALHSAGLTLLAAGTTLVGSTNTCIKNSYNTALFIRSFQGSNDALVSLAAGETTMGKKFKARKIEIEMFRDAIKRAKSLGYSERPACPKPPVFKEEIEKSGMDN
jgi:hypothetical protein